MIAIPILLIVLIILAPTLLSTGVIRNLVVPQVSALAVPNGSLQIRSWSFGWGSGQKISGIRLIDADNIAAVDIELESGLSVLDVIKSGGSQFDIGDTLLNVNMNRLKIDADGSNNLQRTFEAKPGSSTPSEKSEPSGSDQPIKVPDVKGTLKLNLQGTVELPPANGKEIAPIKIDPATTLTIDLNDLENGVKIDGLFTLVPTGEAPITVRLKGSADAIDKGIISTDPNQLDANMVLAIDQINLAILRSILPAMGVDTQQLAGTFGGGIKVDIKRGGFARITSDLAARDVVFQSSLIQNDVARLREVKLPLNVSRDAGSDVIRLDAIGIESDLGKAIVTGEMTQAIAMNLADQKPPGGTGQIVIETDVPSFAAVTKMFPNLVQLQKGVAVTSGGFNNSVTLSIKPTGVDIAQTLQVEAGGIADNRPIRIDTVKIDSTASVLIVDGQPISPSSLKQFTTKVAAPFMAVDASGTVDAINAKGDIDFTKLYAQANQFVDLKDISLAGSGSFALNTKGSPLDLSKPISASGSFTSPGLSFGQGGQKLLDNESVSANFAADVSQVGELTTVLVNALSVDTKSGLAMLKKVGDKPAKIVMSSTGGIGGDAEFEYAGDLDRLAAIAMPEQDDQTRLKQGSASGNLTMNISPDGKTYTINNTIRLTRLDVGSLLSNESLSVTSNATLPSDFSSATASADITSAFANVKVSNVAVLLMNKDGTSPAPAQMLQTLTFAGDVPDLAKLYALANSFGPIDPLAGTPDVATLGLGAGQIRFAGDVKQGPAAGELLINLDVPAIEKLSFTRGKKKFIQASPMTVNLAAQIRTNSTQQNAADQLKSVTLSKLVATWPELFSVEATQPISLTNLQASTPDASGKLTLTAQLAPIGQLLDVVLDSNPIPYTGSVTSEQTISTKNDEIVLAGGTSMRNLTPVDPAAQPLPVNQIIINNDATFVPSTMTATLRDIKLYSPGNDAVAVQVKGEIRDVGGQSIFDEPLNVAMSYDLQKLWPLLQPIVDPENGFGKVQAVGKRNALFVVSGSYPSMKKGKVLEFNDSIRSITASGDVGLDQFTIPGFGIDISDATVPILLKDGVATIAYPDGRKFAPITVNQGTSDLSNIRADLTALVPTITIAKDQALVKDLKLNNVLAANLGKYASVLFSNANKATGNVNVKVVEFNNVPADIVSARGKQIGAIELSIDDLFLDGLVPQLMASALDLGTEGMRGTVTGSVVRFQDGISYSDLTVRLVRREMQRNKQGENVEVLVPLDLRFVGQIDLETLSLRETQLEFPTVLVKSKEVQRFLGPTMVIPIRGSIDKPQFDIGKAIQANVQKGLIPGLIDGALNKDNNKDQDKNRDDKKEDPLGDLIDILGGNKKKDNPRN